MLEAVWVVKMRVPDARCDGDGRLSPARYYDCFEEAFAHWLEEYTGGAERVRSGLAVRASGCVHRTPAYRDELLSIEVRPVSAGAGSITMSFTVERGNDVVALGSATYMSDDDGILFESLKKP